MARTGAPWRDLPEEFGKSVYRQFRRWTPAGAMGRDQALNRCGAVPDAVQMIDVTVIDAPWQAAGAQRRLRDRILAVQEVASRPGSTGASMQQAGP